MKNLLFYFLLLMTLLQGACSNDDTAPAPEEPGLDFEVTAGMDLAGKVWVDNQAAEGVVVSDGYNVVLTDAQGIYQMKRNTKAKFVFVSLPANCKVPVKGNLAAFYAPIDPSKEIVKANFQLEGAETENNFVLVAVADPQTGSDYEVSRLRNEGAYELAQLSKAAGNVPHYGMLLGDIVWDQMNLFDAVKSTLAGVQFPLFAVIGNHDHDLNVVNDDEKASVVYEQQFGPRYYSFNRGECHFIVLDDVDYSGGADKGYSARISAEQLAWLEKDLSHVGKDKLILLNVHIPTKRRMSSSQVENNAELYRLLEGYRVEIMSAHTHYNITTTISPEIREHTHGAICGAFWSGDINVDGTPNGYGVYEIEGNRIKDGYYKSVRKDRSHQMRLYSANTLPPVNGKIVANIWNWHTDWTVKVYENGILKGNMQQTERNDYDPFAYDFLTVHASQHPHPSAALADQTDHLFYYVPEDSAATIKVEATDPYGNVYSGEIK